VNLSHQEVQAAYYGLSGFVRHQVLGLRPVPPEVAKLVTRLDLHVRMSSTRHESDCETTSVRQSEVWIGAAAAASLLGKPGDAGLRWVQRHAEALGGQLTGNRWFFRESDIIDYLGRLAHVEPQP
jgi:hypothetical protein